MLKQLVALGGLPRTGSTLLSSILDQNPAIHAEGNSALCQLMWDLQQSCQGPASEQLNGSNRTDMQKKMVSALPGIYYKKVKKPIVLDKCRAWPSMENLKMLKDYVPNPPKVIVLERPLREIVTSMVALRRANGWEGDLEVGLLTPGSDLIMRPRMGVRWAKNNNNGEFLFLTYDELVKDTQGTLDKIYAFCGWEPFKHDLENIVNKYPENDEFYGLMGMHDVRPTIGRRGLDVKLSAKTEQLCEFLDNEL